MVCGGGYSDFGKFGEMNILVLGKDFPFLKMRSLANVVLGSLLLVMSAKIAIPIGPVPVTFQTLVLMLLALHFGARDVGAVVALYLFYGLLGFPVFAGTPEKGIGLVYMMGTTGGY